MALYCGECCVDFFCEVESPAAKPQLAQDETIINPYYMRQLLTYGIKLGQQQQNAEMDPDELLKEAEVCTYLFPHCVCSVGDRFVQTTAFSG